VDRVQHRHLPRLRAAKSLNSFGRRRRPPPAAGSGRPAASAGRTPAVTGQSASARSGALRSWGASSACSLSPRPIAATAPTVVLKDRLPELRSFPDLGEEIRPKPKNAPDDAGRAVPPRPVARSACRQVVVLGVLPAACSRAHMVSRPLRPKRSSTNVTSTPGLTAHPLSQTRGQRSRSSALHVSRCLSVQRLGDDLWARQATVRFIASIDGCCCLGRACMTRVSNLRGRPTMNLSEEAQNRDRSLRGLR